MQDKNKAQTLGGVGQVILEDDRGKFWASPATPRCPYRYPLVLDDVIDGQSLFGIGLEHVLDEVLGVLRHVCPLGFGELVLTRTDPLLHPR